MSDFNLSRAGQANLSGDPKALFLKIFAGEVMATFVQEEVTSGLHMNRTIPSGKSAQFINVGNVSAEYHVPGAELVGLAVPLAETIINIDGKYVTHATIADIDEFMAHYDVRSPISTEMGRKLAREKDKRVLRCVARAARTFGKIAGTEYSNSGSSGVVPSGYTSPDAAALSTYNPRPTTIGDLQNASAKTNASILLNLIWNAHRILDEKNIPSTDRSIVVAPAQYQLLLANPSGGAATAPIVINKDWGGEGSYAQGNIAMIGGAPIIKTNHMPTTDVTNDTAVVTSGNNYNGDFSKTAALVFHKGAVGTVSLKDLVVESERDIRRQAHFMVASYVKGHGVLRPECAVEIGTGDIASAKVAPTA